MLLALLSAHCRGARRGLRAVGLQHVSRPEAPSGAWFYDRDDRTDTSGRVLPLCRAIGPHVESVRPVTRCRRQLIRLARSRYIKNYSAPKGINFTSRSRMFFPVNSNLGNSATVIAESLWSGCMWHRCWSYKQVLVLGVPFAILHGQKLPHLKTWGIAVYRAQPASLYAF